MADSHRLLPRFRRSLLDAEWEQKLAEILLETGEPLPKDSDGQVYFGDPRELRGIPVVGGAGGAITGTRPGDSLERDGEKPAIK